MCILLHLEFLAGTDMVARNLVELAQFSHGSVVAFCYLRQGVTTLDGYVSSSALTLSASALVAPAALRLRRCWMLMLSTWAICSR